MTQSVQLEQIHIPTRKEDVATIDGILNAFYEVISGPAGQPRQWERDRTLYAPGALFVPTGVDAESGPYAHLMDQPAYQQRSESFFANGFFEREIHRLRHTFGNVTHVFSTYEARRTPDGPVIARGVNSIELVYAGGRWWIVAALWDTERPGNPIPQAFCPDQEA